MFDIFLVTFRDLLNPEFYIQNGGLWLLLFIVFAETGLFAGFFLPGDSLLFVAGIYSFELANEIITTNNEYMALLVLMALITVAGVIGNTVGYWFGSKSGPYLFRRKDTFFYKKKYLFQAKDFYDKHGGGAIIFARFLPIIRTFAPIVAGIVGMDKKKFAFFNVVGCIAWVVSMIVAGHFLYTFFLKQFNFDLKSHLEIIVLCIVAVTTVPVIIKLVFGKTKTTVDDLPK
ncbi:DedA family protein [Aridibaculum aurantiacum]|uniref:DedA family protein n=1 Tax=Aridibaculum aurantiacum TaxID=2810307 RepID=UPI001A974E1C|nr:VTT domain-containing protein [Aridibaculum aurantiacum]